MTEEKVSLFSLGEIGEILGSITEGDPGFHHRRIFGVSTDTRTVRQGELFIAIKGEKHDAHDFLDIAFAEGAEAAVVDKIEAEKRGLSGQRYFIVENTLTAMGQLASAYRRKMPAKIIGVTGSNGKTTVKNLIHSVISSQGPALKSYGNFNNLIGLPISIFKLRKEHRLAVFEMGMSARGEILRLGEIANPDLGVITNVGPVHLEFLKTIEEVALAKLEILEHLNPVGVLILNGDDKLLTSKLKPIKQRIIRFGLELGNDITPGNLEFDNAQMAHFRIDNHELAPQLPGIHNVYNVLAAYAVAQALGINSAAAVVAINSFQPEGMRSEVIHKNGLTLLVDCYNANPASTRIALETLARIKGAGRRIAILGDMLELGDDASLYHKQIGELAVKLGIDYVFAIGPLSQNIAQIFDAKGFHFNTNDDLTKSLVEFVEKGDMLLFKGSRGMALEEVVNVLIN